MAQEKLHLPELNERMAKKLRVQDAFAVDEADQAQGDTYEQLDDVDLGNNTNTNTSNNNRNSPIQNNYIINNKHYNPQRNNSPIHDQFYEVRGYESEEDEEEQTSEERRVNLSNNAMTNNEHSNSPKRNNSPIHNRFYEDDGYEREEEREEGREERIDEREERREERREQEDEEDIDFGVLIVEFSQLTGEEDQGKILAVLEKHNWNLEKSVSSFLDEQDSRYYYQPTYNPSPYHTTTTTSSHYATATDYNSRDEGATSSQIGTFDENDENDNASTYANPDTRQDVSDESDDEAYTKMYGLPSINVNTNDRFDRNEYTAFHDTIDDHVENKDTETDEMLGKTTFVSPYDKYRASTTTTSTNNNNYYDNNNSNENNNNNNNNNNNIYNNNDNNSINSNFDYEYEYNNTLLNKTKIPLSHANYDNNNNNNDNNNNNNNNDNINTNSNNNNNNNNFEYTTFNSYKTKIPSHVPSTEDYSHDLGYDTKFFCKLAVPGSGWATTTSVMPGRTSLKLLCVEQLRGMIVPHEKLIQLLGLCEQIDCYAYHQLIFGTASRCYYSLRTYPSFQKLSEAIQERLRDYMSDGWE